MGDDYLLAALSGALQGAAGSYQTQIQNSQRLSEMGLQNDFLKGRLGYENDLAIQRQKQQQQSELERQQALIQPEEDSKRRLLDAENKAQIARIPIQAKANADANIAAEQAKDYQPFESFSPESQKAAGLQPGHKYRVSEVVANMGNQNRQTIANQSANVRMSQTGVLPSFRNWLLGSPKVDSNSVQDQTRPNLPIPGPKSDISGVTPSGRKFKVVQ